MNVLLLVVGIVFFACVIIGYKRGLIKIVASLLATLVTILLVILLSPHISQWIKESTSLEDIVQKKCIEMLTPDAESEDTLLETEISREEQISLIEGAELPEIFQKMLLENNNSEVYATLGVSTFGEYVGSYIAKIIADILAFLISFVVIMIIIRVAIGMLGIVGKLPLIGGINHLAGGVVGVGIGILVIWIMFIVITLLYNTSIGAMCLEDIAESQILTKLYDSNILMKYITKF